MRNVGVGISLATLVTLGSLASCSDDTPAQPGGKDAGGVDATRPSNDDGGVGVDSSTPGTEGGPDAAGPQVEPLGGDVTRPSGLAADIPLSGVVAMSVKDGATDVATHVRSLTDRWVKDQLAGVEFPLKTSTIATSTSDRVRTATGTRAHLVAKWFDPLTNDANGPRFGANADFVAFVGDGWDSAGNAPQWNGSGTVGWLWVNHEYISGLTPAAGTGGVAGVAGTAPTNQGLWFAQWLVAKGTLAISNPASGALWTQPLVDTYVAESRKQLGGSWMKIAYDAATGAWTVDKAAANKRYDATVGTLTKITGTALLSADGDEAGGTLPAGVAVGTSSNCSGGVSPWGTILTGEENVQFNYGDIETCWASDNTFRPGKGCDVGANLTLPTDPAVVGGFFNKHSNAALRHRAEFHNYLAEIDVGQAPGEYDGKTTAGVGHKKLGSLGRARWENATFAVDASWKLLNNQPIVMYAADDRVSGRIFKWVSAASYTTGMTKAQTRALMDAGNLYVAHFAGIDNRDGYKMLATGTPPTAAAPGTGQWIRLSTLNTTDDAPNAAALGVTGAQAKVGEALKALSYNRIGGFPADDAVRRALFTASNKIGVMELNRPEDIEWNPKSPLGGAQLFVAFTKDTAKTALNQQGVVFDPAPDAGAVSVARRDTVGAIFAMEETNSATPAASTTFKFFQVWGGAVNAKDDFSVANPDNLLLDKDGGVWFGTDGNFEVNGNSDAVYYLDLAAAHKAGAAGVVKEGFGKAFRVLATPSDSEATGPAFSTDMKTLFVAVQHPGEERASSGWPAR